MAEELETYAANVFLPGCLGPVRRDVVLLSDHEEYVEALRAQLPSQQGSEPVAPGCCGNPENCPIDYGDCPHLGAPPGQQGAEEAMAYADPDAVAVAVQRWELQGFASELARITHDERTPNETSQELASLLIAVRALLAGEEWVNS